MGKEANRHGATKPSHIQSMGDFMDHNVSTPQAGRKMSNGHVQLCIITGKIRQSMAVKRVILWCKTKQEPNSVQARGP